MLSHLTNVPMSAATNNKIVLDVSEYQTLTIQIIGGAGTRSILGTNDPGDIQGVTDGDSRTATNFTPVFATSLNIVGQTLVSGITDAGLYRIDPVSFKYLQIGDGATATATKVLVFKTKPY